MQFRWRNKCSLLDVEAKIQHFCSSVKFLTELRSTFGLRLDAFLLSVIRLCIFGQTKPETFPSILREL